jgi:hypothetical protein
MVRSIIAIIFLIICAPKESIGQNTPDDSVYLLKARNNTIQVFLDSMKELSPVYQGREFIPYNQNIKGSPFFLNTGPVSGTQEYNGIEYPNIKFALDMVSDKVVLKNYTSEYLMIAPSEKIRRFTLGNHSFFRPEADIRFRGLSDTGFYEIIYPGKTMVVAKKTKQIQYYQGEDIPYQFTSYSSYYVYDQFQFREINNQKDLLSIYKNKEGEIRKYLHNQKINYKRNKEETLIQSAKYFDQILK